MTGDPTTFIPWRNHGVRGLLMSTYFFAKKSPELYATSGAKNTWLRDPKELPLHSVLGRKGKTVPHRALRKYRGSRSISPLLLDLCTRWRWVVSFTPRPPYSSRRIVFWRGYKYLADSNRHLAIRRDSVYLSNEVSETDFAQLFDLGVITGTNLRLESSGIWRRPVVVTNTMVENFVLQPIRRLSRIIQGLKRENRKICWKLLLTWFVETVWIRIPVLV
jgi:hypothetical protein